MPPGPAPVPPGPAPVPPGPAPVPPGPAPVPPGPAPVPPGPAPVPPTSDTNSGDLLYDLWQFWVNHFGVDMTIEGFALVCVGVGAGSVCLCAICCFACCSECGRIKERKARRKAELELVQQHVMTLNNDGNIRPMWSKDDIYSSEFGETPVNPMLLSEIEAERGLRLRLLV